MGVNVHVKGLERKLYRGSGAVMSGASMPVVQLISEWGDNLTYLVICDATRKAFVVDTSGNRAGIKEHVVRNKAEVLFIIHTHAHGDHIGGSGELAHDLGARTVVHRTSKRPMDVLVGEDDVLRVGNMLVGFLHTPGHTPESMCVHQGCNLFTGDTLFVGECGRTDLPGGDSNALYDSFKKLRMLPDETVVWPGHSYGGLRSTMGIEKRTNYTLDRRTREEFIRFMAEP